MSVARERDPEHDRDARRQLVERVRADLAAEYSEELFTVLARNASAVAVFWRLDRRAVTPAVEHLEEQGYSTAHDGKAGMIYVEEGGDR